MESGYAGDTDNDRGGTLKPRVIDLTTAQLAPEIKEQINVALDVKMFELRHFVQQQISNMQIDLIRQLMQQEQQLESFFEKKKQFG